VTGVQTCALPICQFGYTPLDKCRGVHHPVVKAAWCHFQKLTARIAEGGFTDRYRGPFSRRDGALLSERRAGRGFVGWCRVLCTAHRPWYPVGPWTLRPGGLWPASFCSVVHLCVHGLALKPVRPWYVQ